MKGQITSLFDPTLGARILIGPDGAVIPTPGSVTQGINEGIAKAIAERWAFRCLPHETVQMDDMLTIPPCAYADIDLGSTDFQFNPAGNKPALYMNSFNGGRFHHSGRLMYSGAGTCGAYISPSSPDPIHGQKIIQNAEIEFGYLWINGVNVGQGVIYDVWQGSIMNNKKLDWLCVNGWDGAHNRMAFGVYVTVPPDQWQGFNENIIRIGQMQGFSQIGVLVGNGSPQSLYVGDNEWDVMLNSTGIPGEQPTCYVNTHASYDEWRISGTIYTGTITSGLIFQPGANYNSYKIRQITVAPPTQVQDFGVGNRRV